MSATLLLGNCLEIMKSLPDKSIDCFVCDLPYGQLIGGAGKEKARRKENDKTDIIAGCSWDIKLDLDLFWKEVKRLCRDDHTPILMFCNTKFGYELIKSNEEWFRYDLVWNKERGVSFLLANKMPMKSHEMIYVFSKKSAYYHRIDVKTDKGKWIAGNKTDGIKSRQYHIKQIKDTVNKQGGEEGMRCPLSIITCPNTTNDRINKGHPTEKPIELYEWLLRRYVVEGGTILDPTAGSFNSIRVAKQIGLHAIGIEKDEGFFYKAMKYFL